MHRKVKDKEINTESVLKYKKKASLLANSIRELKDRGININNYEPIEGIMFWPDEI